MHSRRALAAIIFLIFLHCWFGLNMILALPPWEAYDEPGHFSYAASIAARGTLPQENDAEPNPERIQPPLYYLGLAAFLRLSGSDVSQFHFPEQNPQFYFNDHQIAYALHPVRTAGDQRLEVILVASRVASLLVSLISIPFTYLAAQRLWPGDPKPQVAAAAIFALWPQFLFNGSMVSNDGTTAVIGAAVTWLLLWFAARPSSRTGFVVLTAIIVGVGVKLTLLALIAGLIAAILLTASPRLIGIFTVVGGLTIIGAIVILEASPSILLPFFKPDAAGQYGLSALWKYFGNPETPPFVVKTLHNTLATAFGVFGWGQLPLPDSIQQLWIAGFALACLGLLIMSIQRKLTRQVVILISVLGGLLISGLALALFYQIIYWLPGRYLLPGLSATSLLIVLGWSAFRVGKLSSIITWAVVAGMIVLDLLIPGRFLAPLFAPPPAIEEATIPHYGPGELAPGVEILGYDVPSKSARPGEEIEINVYWKADYAIVEDYTVRIELIGPDKQHYGLLDTYPAYGVYPTSRWAVEVPFRDSYVVRIDPAFPAPATAHFQISMMRDDFERTRVLDDVPVEIR